VECHYIKKHLLCYKEKYMLVLNLSVLNFMMGLKVLFDLPLSRERIRT